MTGRSVCLIAVILLSVGVSRSEAQTYGPPTSWTSGPMNDSGTGVPITPHYTPGSANWAYDDITADRGGLYDDSPLDEFVLDVARDAFFRVEWLQWSFRKPGDNALGAPILSTVDVREKFDVTVSGTNFGQAHVETLRDLTIKDMNGIRGTLGLPLAKGDVEANVFAFSDYTGSTLIDHLGEPTNGDPFAVTQFVATTTLTNGQLGNNTFLYDREFSTAFKSSLWGSEVNYVFDAALTPPFIQFRPMFGFRYLGINENLIQRGVFDGLGQLTEAQIVRTTIGSDTKNTVYVPQVGFRLEMSSRWLTVALEPKFGLGVNQFRGAVFTESLRSVGDPLTITNQTGERLSATGEVAVHGRLHLNKHVSVTVGYTFLFIDNVTRPQNSIRYNDNGLSADPAVVVRSGFDLMYYQGLNLGAEIRY